MAVVRGGGAARIVTTSLAAQVAKNSAPRDRVHCCRSGIAVPRWDRSASRAGVLDEVFLCICFIGGPLASLLAGAVALAAIVMLKPVSTYWLIHPSALTRS